MSGDTKRDLLDYPGWLKNNPETIHALTDAPNYIDDEFQDPLNLYTPEKKNEEQAVVQDVRAMPTVNDASAMAARRRAIVRQMARRGRASTILTDTETLG